MAKRRRKRKSRSSAVSARCKMIKVDTSGKFDKVKVGNRLYRSKSRAMEVHNNGKTWVCPVGKGFKLSTTSGKLEALHKVPKKRRR